MNRDELEQLLKLAEGATPGVCFLQAGWTEDGGPRLMVGTNIRRDATQEATEADWKWICALLANGPTLCRQLLDAMWFVPLPKDMSGYGDPEAPEEVKAAIERAARVHGIEVAALSRAGSEA